MDLISEIRKRVDSINTSPEEMYATLKSTGSYMLLTNTLSKENVLVMCSNLIKLYEQLKRG